jgi:hypothetical protein
MFFPFSNYKKITVAAGGSNGQIVYTTTSDCLVAFLPTGAFMEDDAPIGLYVDNYFTDSDGGQADLYLYYSKAATNAPLSLNIDNSSTGLESYTNTMNIVPSGKNIRRLIANSSDKIGGTLYVFELP